MNTYIPFEKNTQNCLQNPNNIKDKNPRYILKNSNVFVANIFEQLALGDSIETITQDLNINKNELQDFFNAIAKDIQEAQEREEKFHNILIQIQKKYPQYPTEMSFCHDGDPRTERTIHVYNVPQEQSRIVRKFINQLESEIPENEDNITILTHIVNEENTKKFYPTKINK